MSNQQNLDLARLLKLSDLMLDKAVLGLWDAVFELQNTRDLLIRELFAQSLGLDVRMVREGVQYILDCDVKLSEAVTAEKIEIQKQMLAIKQSKQAANAYSAMR